MRSSSRGGLWQQSATAYAPEHRRGELAEHAKKFFNRGQTRSDSSSSGCSSWFVDKLTSIRSNRDRQSHVSRVTAVATVSTKVADDENLEPMVCKHAHNLSPRGE